MCVMTGMEIGLRSPGRRKKLSDDDDRRLARDYAEGVPVNDLVRRYEVSKMTVYRTLRRLQKVKP